MRRRDGGSGSPQLFVISTIPCLRQQPLRDVSYNSPQIFEKQKEVQRIRWRGDEIKMAVESNRAVVLGVNGEGPNSRDIGRLKGSPHGVLDKPRPQSLLLPALMHRKAREKHDGDRMAGETLRQVFQAYRQQATSPTTSV